MRSALALLALLLLLSENATQAENSTSSTVKPTTSHKLPTVEPNDVRVTVTTVKQSAAPASSGESGTPAVVSGSTSTAPSSVTVTSTLAQQSTTAAPSGTDGKQTSGNLTASIDGPKDVKGPDKATLTPTTTPTKPETTSSQNGMKHTAGPGSQSSHNITADKPTSEGGRQTTPETSHPVNTLHTASAPSTLTVPTSTHQRPADPVAAQPPGSSSEGPDKITTASSGAGTTAGTPFTSQRTTITLSTVPLSGDQQTSSRMPAITGTSSSVTGTSSSVTGTSSSITGTSSSVTGTSSSVTGTSSSVTGISSSVTGTSSSVTETSASKALQPADPSLGPVATPPVRGPTSSSSQVASTASQGSHVPSSTSAPVDDRINCTQPERLNDKMLILNFTNTSLCDKSLSSEKLITILCRAAKATYNSARDQCRIELAPIPEIQAVAIKGISVTTSLFPKDVYQVLKDKWDDLKEMGVSSMKLGDQGPPEETEDRFSMPLIITIVCMASFLLLVAALYGCCHQRLSQRKDQQRLTEELQTVENGYHDNPTLEVMETSSEMQEKKVVNLNGELGDSWIVPLENLTKDDMDEEEDTHL